MGEVYIFIIYMDNEYYKQKYLKYKLKYIELKNSIDGGARGIGLSKSVSKVTNAASKSAKNIEETTKKTINEEAKNLKKTAKICHKGPKGVT